MFLRLSDVASGAWAETRRPAPPMPITVVKELPGIAEVVIDHPPVNALDVAGWFELADTVTAAGRVPELRVVVLRANGRGFCAGVDIKEINAQGDEALGRRQPGLCGRVRRRLRLRGAGGRRRPRLLPRRRHRTGRQRRHGGGVRGRDVRAARGRPRRVGGRHPPGPAGAPARHAPHGLHRQADHGGRAGLVRLRRGRGPAGAAARRGPGAGGRRSRPRARRSSGGPRSR